MILYLLNLLIILSKVNSSMLDHYTWMDINNQIIKFKDYCGNNKCIIKCCPQGQAMVKNGCHTLQKKYLQDKVNFSNISVYKWDDTSKKVIKTKNTILPYFSFVQNFYFKNLTKLPVFKDVKVLEDGLLKYKEEITLLKHQYCIDYSIKKVKDKRDLVFSSRPINMEDEDPDKMNKYYYVASAFLTSSVFMVLVYIVYSIVPELQTTGGKITKAYLAALICGYVTKAIQLLVNAHYKIDRPTCRIICPIIYFFLISSFFWLNIMSIDLWSKLLVRDNHKFRDTGRSKREKIKFRWYSVYSWGTPLLLTLSIVALDLFVFEEYSLYQPPFGDCFGRELTNQLYLGIPIGILICVNIILFLIIAYHIWRIKSGVDGFKEKSARKIKDRFVIYFRLWFLMGVNWILELVPNQDMIPFIIINFFNVFVGVTLFIIFVCKKVVIISLCKKFNINNRFVEELKRRNQFNSESYKSTSYYRRSNNSRSTTRKKDKEDECEKALAT